MIRLEYKNNPSMSGEITLDHLERLKLSGPFMWAVKAGLIKVTVDGEQVELDT